MPNSSQSTIAEVSIHIKKTSTKARPFFYSSYLDLDEKMRFSGANGPTSLRNAGAACAQAFIGAAKSMTSNNPDGLPATIMIEYVFENFSDVLSPSLFSAIDDLRSMAAVPLFGVPDVDNSGDDDWNFVSITSVPASFANPDFNGSDGITVNLELVNQTMPQSLAPSTTVTATLELRTENAGVDLNQIYCNQIVVTGDLGGVRFGDTSAEGVDPDPNGDGVPVEDEPSGIMEVPVELQSFSID